MLFQKMNNSALHAEKTDPYRARIHKQRQLSPTHNNSATNNTDDWYTSLFSDVASISDQKVSNGTAIGVKPIGQGVKRKW
jgi:hypothetical protein